MRTIFALLLLGTLSFACSKKSGCEPAADKRSLEYFSKNLKADLQYNSIVTLFGNPDGDRGSGIHIYVYQLSDSTEVWIGYSDHIHYAKHMDKNGNVLHVIL